MKKIITGFLVMFMAVALSTNVQAQQDFVYDGETFNVWLKVNSANTQVLEVYFTSGGEWNQFSIVDYIDFEGDGFAFEVKDGAGAMFYIDYFTEEDYIVVTSEDETSTWELERRED